LNKSLNLAATLGVVNLKAIVPTYQVAICLDVQQTEAAKLNKSLSWAAALGVMKLKIIKSVN
jgi:hypothetical protein